MKSEECLILVLGIFTIFFAECNSQQAITPETIQCTRGFGGNVAYYTKFAREKFLPEKCPGISNNKDVLTSSEFQNATQRLSELESLGNDTLEFVMNVYNNDCRNKKDRYCNFMDMMKIYFKLHNLLNIVDMEYNKTAEDLKSLGASKECDLAFNCIGEVIYTHIRCMFRKCLAGPEMSEYACTMNYEDPFSIKRRKLRKATVLPQKKNKNRNKMAAAARKKPGKLSDEDEESLSYAWQYDPFDTEIEDSLLLFGKPDVPWSPQDLFEDCFKHYEPIKNSLN